MVYNLKFKILFILFRIYTSTAIPSRHSLNKGDNQEKNIAEILSSSKYIPKEKDLPESRIVSEDSDDDSTILISKLSEGELLQLLRKQPTRQLNNMKVIDIGNLPKSAITLLSSRVKKEKKDSHAQVESVSSDQDTAYFRIDNKKVEPQNIKIGADPSYLAHQKIQNLLYSSPTNLGNLGSDESDEKKEFLFDILTAQLKKLCCKSSNKIKNRIKVPSYEPLLSDIFPNSLNTKQPKDPLQYEQMFLIMNDEIKSDDDSDILFVDPDSLNSNSSVLLLGPITTPLTDSELKIVMSRITTELSKPEYIPLLQELSEGKVDKSNTHLAKSLVSGSNSRRFVKPHRCRTRYPLSQGPKWLICTGYLNINTPSLYD